MAATREHIHKLKERVVAALEAGPFANDFPPGYGTPYVQVKTNIENQVITVEWARWPLDTAAVDAILAEVLDGTGVAGASQLLWPWSCGYFHDDAKTAYLCHHEDEIAEVEYCNSCGHCDGHTIVSADDAYDALAAAGEAPTPDCKPGRWVSCLGCAGRGRTIGTGPKYEVAVCRHCAGRGHLDWDQADQQQQWLYARETIRLDAWAQHQEKHPPVPTVADWAADRFGDGTAEARAAEKAVRRMFGADRSLFDRWQSDASTRGRPGQRSGDR